MVTVAADRHVDMKKLPTLLGIKANANLRLTDPSILGVEKGAVSPYAAINDAKGVVTVALDSELVNSSQNINTHPLRSDRTVSAAPQDVVAFLEAVQHPPKILDFGGNSSAPPPPKKAVTAKPYKKQEKPQPKPQKTASRNKKGSKETLDRIVASKTGDFAAWYGEVITKSEMIEYGNVRRSNFKRPSISRCFSLNTVEGISRRSCPSLETHGSTSTQVRENFRMLHPAALVLWGLGADPEGSRWLD